MRKDRFSLESEILECWNVTSDLDILTEGVLEHDLSKDDIANILLGMKTLYNLKFDKMFNTFETLIRERKIN